MRRASAPFRPMRNVAASVVFLSVATTACQAATSTPGNPPVAASGAHVPIPTDFDRIDYKHPSKYLFTEFSKGSSTLSARIAAQLVRRSPKEELAAVSEWMSTALRVREADAYSYRDFDTIVSEGTYGGCADHALVFGTITRALGIPTVWVKTMDIEWIRSFARGAPPPSWSGHVFL